MTGGSAPADGATKRTGMPTLHGVDGHAVQTAEEGHALGHADDGDDVGRLGGQPRGRERG